MPMISLGATLGSGIDELRAIWSSHEYDGSMVDYIVRHSDNIRK